MGEKSTKFRSASGVAGRWCRKHVLDTLKEEWPSILFPACVAFLLHAMGYLAVLTKISLLIVSSMAVNETTTEPAMNGSGPVALVITEEDYQDRFNERAPLNRCLLAADIEKIRTRGAKSLVIDLDLSPMLGETSAEKECQKNLDRAIDGIAGKIVLLVPFATESATLRGIKREWMQKRCGAGHVFAIGDLEKSLGTVLESRPNINGIPELLEPEGRKKASICEDITDANDPSKANRWLNKSAETSAEHKESGHDNEAINFRAFRKEAIVTSVNEPLLADVKKWGERVVFYGGSYGQDDNFLTPMGELPGVAIHTARLVTSMAHVNELVPFAGLLLDVMIAAIFMFVVNFFWKKYVHLALLSDPAMRETKNYWLMGFVLAYGSICLAAFVAARDLFAYFGISIAPLLISVCMLVDGFMSGPVNAFSHTMHSEKTRQHDVAPKFFARYRGSSWAAFSFRARQAVFWGVLLATLVSLFDRTFHLKLFP